MFILGYAVGIPKTVTQIPAADEVSLFFVRNGHPSQSESWYGNSLWFGGGGGFSWTKSAPSLVYEGMYLTVADGIAPTFLGPRFWGKPLRCLAIE